MQNHDQISEGNRDKKKRIKYLMILDLLTWLWLGKDHAGDESWDLGDLFLYNLI